MSTNDPTADLGADISRFAAASDADELGAAMLVGRALASDFDVARCQVLLDELVRGCPDEVPPWDYLAELGFSGNEGEFDAKLCSRLDWVLDHRRGIPISLAVLLIHLAKALGRPAVGINFPGHFLVRVDDQLVDPFVMAPTTEREAAAQLGRDPSDTPDLSLFAEASPTAILLRMLNNVKFQFARHGEWHRALDMLDWQLCVEPNSAQLFLERGELWGRLGVVGAARAAYARALELGGDAQLEALAQARLSGLGGSDTVH